MRSETRLVAAAAGAATGSLCLDLAPVEAPGAVVFSEPPSC